jgi:REP element-mobilizing transposase RayT
MPRKLRDREDGAFHHVYVRGNRKDDVFRDDEDRRWFLERLIRVERESGCLHVAHCLMTNHIHLLIRPGGAGVSRLLQRVLGGYCQWFNRRHGLVGHLFQGRFGSRVIDSDSDLLWILRYIHRNPVEASMVSRPEMWEWSSHRDHLRPVPPEHLREGVALARRLLAAEPDRAIILYRRLVERPDGDYLLPVASEFASPIRDLPPAPIPSRPTLEALAATVEERFAVARGALRGHGRSAREKEARSAFCRTSTREWGYTLHETSMYLGRSISRVSELAGNRSERGGAQDDEADPVPKSWGELKHMAPSRVGTDRRN